MIKVRYHESHDFDDLIQGDLATWVKDIWLNPHQVVAILTEGEDGWCVVHMAGGHVYVVERKASALARQVEVYIDSE